MTTLIYLIGKPGTGKYTIGKEIAKAGYVLCDNQLINNPVFELLNYDGFAKIPKFAWEIIHKIRNSIFEFIIIDANNYVLTNVLLEDYEDHNLFNQVEEMANKRGSIFVPVKLLIEEEENIKRIQNAERKSRYKSIDPQDAKSPIPLIKISHPNLLELDVTKLTAKKVSLLILSHVINLIENS